MRIRDFMRFGAVLLMVGPLLSCFPPTQPQLGDDAPAQPGDDAPGNEPVAPEAPTFSWAVDSVSGFQATSPTIGPDGTIYVVDHSPGSLIALNPDGSEAWSFSANDVVGQTVPVLSADGVVFFGAGWESGQDNIFAVNTGSGTEEWAVEAPGSFADVAAGPALGPNGILYVTTSAAGDSDNVLALDVSDGSPLWYGDTSTPSVGPAVASDGTVYIVEDEVLSAFPALSSPTPNLDPPTASWSFIAGGAITGDPIIDSDGTIYFGADDGFLYALDPTAMSSSPPTVAEARLFDTGDTISSQAVLGAGDEIYVGTDSGTLYAVNKTDGTSPWDAAIGSGPIAAPAVDDNGAIYVGTAAFDSNIRALNPNGGELRHERNYHRGRSVRPCGRTGRCDLRAVGERTSSLCRELNRAR